MSKDMATPKLNPPLRLLGVFVISLFWGTVVIFNLIWQMIRYGPSKFFERKRRDTRPTCLDDPSLGMHQFLQLKTGVKIHYVISGPKDKPLMLFVHGFPEFWYSWRHQIREFNNDYRTVAFDMRGYGESSKPPKVSDYYVPTMVEDIKELIIALKYEECILVAHDWGGAVAFNFTNKYPDMVHRLIVCNCPHSNAFQKVFATSFHQKVMSWYMFFFQLPWLPELAINRFDMCDIDTYLVHATEGEGASGITNDDREAFKYSLQIPGGLTSPLNYYRATFRYEREPSGSPLIKVKTLMIWGVKDKYLHKDMAATSAKYIPEYTLKYVEGSGHWVQQEEPQITNQYMRSFLKQ